MVTPAGVLGNSYTPPGGGFAPPDLISTTLNDPANNSGFNVGGTFPSGIYTAPNDGVGGSRCMRVTIPITQDGGSVSAAHGLAWGDRTSVYTRAATRIRPGLFPVGNIKGQRYHSTSAGNNGELYSNFAWAFDWDGDQALLDLGIYFGSQPSAQANYGVLPYLENLADGQIHWIEVFYDRNVAGGFVEVSFWVNGVPIVQPAGPCFSEFYGPSFAHPFASWVGGQVGVSPSRIRVTRSAQGGNTIGDCTWTETISQSETLSEVQWDELAASTQRIGPL